MSATAWWADVGRCGATTPRRHRPSGPAGGLSRRRTLTIGGAAARTNPRGALTGTRDARWKTKERKQRVHTTAALAARSLPKDSGRRQPSANLLSATTTERGTGPTSSNVIPQRAAQGPRGRRAFQTPDGAHATSLVASGLLHVRGRIQLILLAAFQILPTSPCWLGWLAKADKRPVQNSARRERPQHEGRDGESAADHGDLQRRTDGDDDRCVRRIIGTVRD
ncbi:hypothetical protein HPB50_025107 [Hyalomma asiaticum]|uniref:Uncharacterized protein n=1 Tax=Hyalomma asiaticum TaxID=266040 RepID=A0ACB7SQ91_HYAAI|nr:hypothetical protein HPB50_025107 [Hyalomma asiaticum]